MPERFTPEEAWREAQFIEKAAQGRAAYGISKSSEAAEYDFLSGSLDDLRHGDPIRYQRALRIGELEKESDTVAPQVREAFFRITGPASRKALDAAISSEDEIKAHVKQQVRLGVDPKSARESKIRDIVATRQEALLKEVERQIAADPELQKADRGDLQKLKDSYLGPETQSLWKERISDALNGLLDNWP